MSKLVDLTGQRLGRFVVLDRAENSPKDNRARWLCRCDCGKTKIVEGKALRSGNTQSCGLGQCWGKRSVTHGQSGNRYQGKKASPSYGSWAAMKQRCLDPNAERYPKYGALGVTITPRWLGPDGFSNFLADLGERPPGTSLGRKNDIGNYEPGNVSWQTSAEQVANWRPDRNLGGGKRKSIQQIAA
jgi:hypothetical protein